MGGYVIGGTLCRNYLLVIMLKCSITPVLSLAWIVLLVLPVVVLVSVVSLNNLIGKEAELGRS